MGRKVGEGCVPLLWGAVAWAQAYIRTQWHLDPSSRLDTTDMGRKLRAVPLGGSGSPSNTMSPGSTSLPSGVLIHPAVWTQQTWAEIGGCAPLGDLGPYLTQCGLGGGLPQYQVAS